MRSTGTIPANDIARGYTNNPDEMTLEKPSVALGCWVKYTTAPGRWYSFRRK